MTMRFQRGDRVEVMNNRDVPISWRTAKILLSHGHCYTIQYELSAGITNDRVVERVTMDSVRPCPPFLPGSEHFDAGDVVEVFYEQSWKAATILEILGVQKVRRRNKACKKPAAATFQCLVRLLGCSLQFVVDISNVRMRRTWDDGKWIIMEKNFRGNTDLATAKSSYQEMNFPHEQFNSEAKDRIGICDDALVREPTEISLRSQKRMSPFDSSIADFYPQNVRKKLGVVSSNQGMKRKVAAVPGKVYAVAHPRQILGGKNMHTSINSISNRYDQKERTKYNNHIGYSGVGNFKLSTDESDTSSVGSCSITSRGENFCYWNAIPLEAESRCSDAESCCGAESEMESSSSPPNHELEGHYDLLLPGLTAYFGRFKLFRFDEMLQISSHRFCKNSNWKTKKCISCDEVCLLICKFGCCKFLLLCYVWNICCKLFLFLQKLWLMFHNYIGGYKLFKFLTFGMKFVHCVNIMSLLHNE